jgi:hypothetical protein
VDFRDYFENISVKWKKLSTLVMAFGHNAHIKNGPACKEKWTTQFITITSKSKTTQLGQDNEEF